MLVGIYHPEFWISHGHWSYENQTPGKTGRWGNTNYRINDKSLREADFIVIHEGMDRSIKNATAGGFVLVTGEEKSIRKYYHPEYLDQFDLIITSRDDIRHPQIKRTHYLHPWWVKKNYDELASSTSPTKTKTLSAIISNLAVLPSHRERFTFIKALKEHYENNLDWFSKGESSFLRDKWDGLAPYKYSIAVENSNHLNYFTEKISDCFLAHTMPIYQGCPNIKDFFDDRSFISIDKNDFLGAIQIIDHSISENLFERNFRYLEESRRLVLEKYHFIAALSDILQNHWPGKEKIKRTLRPEEYFTRGRFEQFRRFANTSIKKVLGR